MPAARSPRLALSGLLAAAACLTVAAAEAPRPPVNPDSLAEPYREPVGKVVSKPTISAHPRGEEFTAAPDLYRWLLDHPDRVSRAWRKMGVTCAEVRAVGPKRFTASDPGGGEVTWETAYDGPDGRVWYAWGVGKPGPLVPGVPVKAVAVLRHTPLPAGGEAVTIRHQVDVYIHSDSRAAAVAARVMGPTAPRMAEQGASQLQMFFSRLASYLNQNPDQVKPLLGDGE